MSPSVEPFNEAKYKALMDGLEISEIYLSKIREQSTTYRLDSHYYEKKYSELLPFYFNNIFNGLLFNRVW